MDRSTQCSFRWHSPVDPTPRCFVDAVSFCMWITLVLFLTLTGAIGDFFGAQGVVLEISTVGQVPPALPPVGLSPRSDSLTSEFSYSPAPHILATAFYWIVATPELLRRAL